MTSSDQLVQFTAQLQRCHEETSRKHAEHQMWQVVHRHYLASGCMTGPHNFWYSMSMAHIESLCLFLRRMHDCRSDSGGLLYILQLVARKKVRLTKQNYIDQSLSRFEPEERNDYAFAAERDWVASVGAMEVFPNRVAQRHIRYINSRFEIIKPYIDKQLAHLHRTSNSLPPPPLHAIRNCFRIMTRAQSYYHRIACASDIMLGSPILPAYWWKNLEVPWIRSPSHLGLCSSAVCYSTQDKLERHRRKQWFSPDVRPEWRVR